MVNAANSITSIVKPVWTLLGIGSNRGTWHALLYAVAPATRWILGTSRTAVKLGTVGIGTASTLGENEMLYLARTIEEIFSKTSNVRFDCLLTFRVYYPFKHRCGKFNTLFKICTYIK